jgi:hypothetical protein
MMRWLMAVLLVLASAMVGYHLMFGLRFVAVVLPHGGMW